jgi:hypothetical protein
MVCFQWKNQQGNFMITLQDLIDIVFCFFYFLFIFGADKNQEKTNTYHTFLLVLDFEIHMHMFQAMLVVVHLKWNAPLLTQVYITCVNISKTLEATLMEDICDIW